MNSFLSDEELKYKGFKYIGQNVLISKNACFYGIENIIIHNNVRIDDFVILSGNIEIRNNVHIGAYSAVFAGSHNVFFNDFSGLSSRVSVYASSDDYSGNFLTNPTIPDRYRNVLGKDIIFGKHSIVGASCVILPGAYVGEGTAIGSMSLLTKKTNDWSIYGGIPAKFIKERNKKLLDLENSMR